MGKSKLVFELHLKKVGPGDDLRAVPSWWLESALRELRVAFLESGPSREPVLFLDRPGARPGVGVPVAGDNGSVSWRRGLPSKSFQAKLCITVFEAELRRRAGGLDLDMDEIWGEIL
jgi:hypothetical protein